MAILLVVVGHVVAREPPRGADWYVTLKAVIYLFHMPLFMFLSGMAAGIGFRMPASAPDYLHGVRKRVPRLIGGYLLLGLLIFAGKLVFQRFTHVDNPVNGWSSLLDLLIRPTTSYTSFLWYVYSLSILYLVVPPLTAATRGRLWPLLALACVLPFLPGSTLLTWNKLQEFGIFFVLGMVAGRHHERFERLIVRAWPFAMLGFAALVPTLLREPPPPLRLDALLAVVGVMGMIHLPSFSRAAWLTKMGAYTLSIYLFNTIAIGVVKTAIVATFGWDGPRFVLVFIVLTMAGVGIPMLLKHKVFARIRWLDRIT